jgi:hypothetical protein
MSVELHVQINPGSVGEPEELLAGFPFEPGQSIVTYAGGIIVIDLAGADDTTYVQDWYLNSNDDVFSFYVVED